MIKLILNKSFCDSFFHNLKIDTLTEKLHVDFFLHEFTHFLMLYFLLLASTHFYPPCTEFELSLPHQSHKQHRQYYTSSYQSYILDNKIEFSPIFSKINAYNAYTLPLFLYMFVEAQLAFDTFKHLKDFSVT